MNSEKQYPLISIIVPVFNNEKYIKECIESIISQTYKNIEIIIVNDGSTDNSRAVCEEYTKLDNRIILINKGNSGVSDTRNVGIKTSKGEFLMFIDSDDYIKNNYVETMLKCCLSKNLDICKTGLTFFDNKKYEKKCYLKSKEFKMLDKEEILYNISSSNLFNSSCTLLIKSEIIKNNNLIFENDIAYGEDLLFFWDCVKVSKKIGYINNCDYYYRNNPLSVIHEKNINSRIKFINDNIYVYKRFIKMNKFNENFVTLLYYKFNFAFKYIIRKGITFNEFKNIINKNINDIIQENRKFFNIKTAQYANRINKLEIKLLYKKRYRMYYYLIYLLNLIKNK